MTTVRKTLSIASWLLTVLCMAAIFFFSHQSADESAEVSIEIYSGILALLGQVIERLGHEGVRTIAHFIEYCALGFLMSTSLTFTFSKPKPWLAWGLAAGYAVTDELHQLFVPGRAFQVTDLAIDAGGTLLGIGIFCLLALLVQKSRQGCH